MRQGCVCRFINMQQWEWVDAEGWSQFGQLKRTLCGIVGSKGMDWCVQVWKALLPFNLFLKNNRTKRGRDPRGRSWPLIPSSPPERGLPRKDPIHNPQALTPVGKVKWLGQQKSSIPFFIIPITTYILISCISCLCCICRLSYILFSLYIAVI